MNLIDQSLIDRFMQRDMKRASQRLYGLVLGWFKQAATSSDDLETAIATFREKRCKGAVSSQRLYMTVISVFLKWCVDEGVIEKAPMPPIRWGAKESVNPKHTLSKDEVKLLVREIGQDSRETGVRDLAMVLLMLHTGLRAISVSNIDVEDFSISGERRILHYLGKGHRSKDLYVIPPKRALDAISQYLKASNRNWKSKGPLFVIARAPRRRLETDGVRAAVESRLRGAGLRRPGITTHSLRHTAASFAYAATKDIKATQELLGHSSPVTTELYLHSLDRVEKPVEDAIDFGLED